MGICYCAEEMLIDFVGQKIKEFYNPISKIVLIKVLKSINNKREAAENIDFTVVKGEEEKKIPLRDCSKSSLKIFNTDPFAF